MSTFMAASMSSETALPKSLPRYPIATALALSLAAAIALGVSRLFAPRMRSRVTTPLCT